MRFISNIILPLTISVLFITVKSYSQHQDTVYLKQYNLKAIGKYNQKKEDGLWMFFYSNNKIQSKGYYKDGKFIGKWSNWYSDGVKQSEGSYENNFKEGQWTDWDVQGRLTHRITWHNGKKNGIAEEYDYVKKEIKTTSFKEDSLNGKALWVTLEGTKKLEGEYTMGLKTGLWTWYFPNGKIESQGRLENDKLEGEHIWYNEQGEKIGVAKYKNGIETK